MYNTLEKLFIIKGNGLCLVSKTIKRSVYLKSFLFYEIQEPIVIKSKLDKLYAKFFLYL